MTMVAIVVVLLFAVLADDFAVAIPVGVRSVVCDVLMYLSALLTVISGVVYCYDSREYIDPSK